MAVKEFFYDTFSRFDTIPECRKRKDERTVEAVVAYQYGALHS